jgi:hypothetical protein
VWLTHPLDKFLLSSFRELTVRKPVKKQPGLIESRMFCFHQIFYMDLI